MTSLRQGMRQFLLKTAAVVLTFEQRPFQTHDRFQRMRIQKNKVGQRTQKQHGAQHAFFKKSCGVGSCALRKTDVGSLLKHRARCWYHRPQFTTVC